MWPYDYSREDETPLLWVSEGFTNYYGGVALYRAGLRTRQQFVQSVEGAINGVEVMSGPVSIASWEASAACTQPVAAQHRPAKIARKNNFLIDVPSLQCCSQDRFRCGNCARTVR